MLLITEHLDKPMVSYVISNQKIKTASGKEPPITAIKRLKNTIELFFRYNSPIQISQDQQKRDLARTVIPSIQLSPISFV